MWVTSAFDHTSILIDGYLSNKGKANMRQLTKAEAQEFEQLRLATLLNLTPMCDLNDGSIYKAISEKFKPIPSELKEIKVLGSQNLNSLIYCSKMFSEQFILM